MTLIYIDYLYMHIQWISDAHKRLLAEMPMKDIWEQLFNIYSIKKGRYLLWQLTSR